MDVCR